MSTAFATLLTTSVIADSLFLPPEKVALAGIPLATSLAHVTGVDVAGEPVLFFRTKVPGDIASVQMARPVDDDWLVSTVLSETSQRGFGFFSAGYANGRILVAIGIIEGGSTWIRVFSTASSGGEWKVEVNQLAHWDYGFERHASIITVGNSAYIAYPDRTLGPGKIGILRWAGENWSSERPEMEIGRDPALITGGFIEAQPHFVIGTDPGHESRLAGFSGDRWTFRVLPEARLPVMFSLNGRASMIGFLRDLQGLAIGRIGDDGRYTQEPILPVERAVLSYDAIQHEDQPLVAYFSRAPEPQRVRIARPGDGGWVHEDIADATAEWLRQIDLFDLRGAPALAFMNSTDGFVYFARSIQVPTKPFVRGDANGDLTADIADVVWMLSEMFRGGPRTACATSGDVNADGRYDAADPMTLVAYWFQHGSPPSAPFPACGSPGSTDVLGCDSSACESQTGA